MREIREGAVHFHEANGNQSALSKHTQIPEGLQDLIDGYIEEIKYCMNNDTVTLFHAAEWNKLFSVCNLLGKIVLQKENLNHSELDVSPLPSGMYLLRLRTTYGTGMTAKFVKN